MASSFHSIGTMTTALRAFQRELDVTGHNLANVNTPGYTRQVADLAANDPSSTFGRSVALGNGVSVTSVNRIRDMFLEARRNEVGADVGRFGAQSEGLSQVEAIVHDPNAPGIDDALGAFFDSWSALASNPNQPSLKQQAMQAGQTLADRLKSTHGQLESLKNEQTAKVDDTIGRINELASGIAKLNDEIRKATNEGGTPNDLLDQRDSALRELSGLADIKTQSLSDGTVTVSLNQASLVNGADYRELPTTPIDPATGTIGTGDAKVEIRGGQLKGQFEVLNGISSAQQRLDSLADAMRNGVNAVHGTGTNAAGATGVRFFNEGTGAAGLDLDAAVKGKPEAIATGKSGAAGDGDVALALSRLRDQGSTALGGRTFEDDFADTVAQVGRNAKSATDSLDINSSLATQIDNQVQSVSGVSMDDEMANMLRFQRSYQAAAKALSTFDSVFDDLLGLLR